MLRFTLVLASAFAFGHLMAGWGLWEMIPSTGTPVEDRAPKVAKKTPADRASAATFSSSSSSSSSSSQQLPVANDFWNLIPTNEAGPSEISVGAAGDDLWMITAPVVGTVIFAQNAARGDLDGHDDPCDQGGGGAAEPSNTHNKTGASESWAQRCTIQTIEAALAKGCKCLRWTQLSATD